MTDYVTPLLAAWRSVQFVREQTPNAGPGVTDMLKLTGLGPGHPWCAAGVAWCGVAALGDRWPVPRTASCYQLGEWGRKKKVLRDAPAPGAIFLIYFDGLRRFGHTGIVESVEDDGYIAWEGNTNPGGGREGYGVFRRKRKVGPKDRFLYWWEAL